jgi:hypothetical protein
MAEFQFKIRAIRNPFIGISMNSYWILTDIVYIFQISRFFAYKIFIHTSLFVVIGGN